METLPDEDLLDRFLDRAIGPDEWTHELHVRIGWLHVRRFGPESALEGLRSGIRRLNAANGVANDRNGGYHETITRLWIALIHDADSRDRPPASTSAAFVAAHPELLDFGRTYRYFSESTLWSEQARAHWVEPDQE
jgi:hypothetical protein